MYISLWLILFDILEFRSKFRWNLFLKVQLTLSSIGSDDGVSPTRRQAIIWTNDG